MAKTVLIIPFVVDETNAQVFLHKEVTLPQPLPDLVYLGTLPTETQVRDIQSYLLSRFAHQISEHDPWKPLTNGPVYDVNANINYVILEDGRKFEERIPFLCQQGWSKEPLPDWLLSFISKPRRDPHQTYDM